MSAPPPHLFLSLEVLAGSVAYNGVVTRSQSVDIVHDFNGLNPEYRRSAVYVHNGLYTYICIYLKEILCLLH